MSTLYHIADDFNFYTYQYDLIFLSYNLMF